ncbi:FCD domain-containing protein [Falsirhodobacter sp. 1013]|uniref:GntR family transcriptional regulator n=1 Tax=Falsirhodobacter sp. 1013 TaxID=3417566 RepID=UPI003EB6C9D2
MARSDTRFREAFNSLLDVCNTLPVGAELPAEAVMSGAVGVSRTVVRRCLTRMAELGIIAWEGRGKHLLRAPTADDRIALPETTVGRDQLEKRFLGWVLQFDVPADTPLSVAELARTFDVAPHELKEFLASLSRFGLVARRPRGGWMLRGFTREFAIELSDFRLILELDAIAKVAEAPVDHPIWQRLANLRLEHEALARRITTDFHEFSKLDEAFHQAINSVVRNRFMEESQKVISLIFHYHYMWDKTHEMDRNRAAINEHMAIIDALEARDTARACEAARQHLRTSKSTLLLSLRHHALG